MKARKLLVSALAAAFAAPIAWGQIPDLLNAFDAGGRAMGFGGGTYVSGFDTLSSYYNPAGLAFASGPQAGLVIRNLSQSNTVISRDFADPDFDTRPSGGNLSLTHAGYAFPLNRAKGGGAGTIGIAFTTAGYVRDERRGDQIPSGDVFVSEYFEVIKSRTDFLTVSYGRSLGARLNVGLGLAYAINSLTNIQRYNLLDRDENLRGRVVLDNSSTGNGLGLVAGLQLMASESVTFGLSYRSEIDLSNNAKTRAFYDKIPARLSGGVAMRRDGLRGGRDYAVIAGQIDHFFKADRNTIIDRKEQTVFGGGIEYNMAWSGARVPFRLGYQAAPSGGAGFKPRNSVTFGIGYHPNGNAAAFDLNFGIPEGGSVDVGFGISYKFGN
jgi:long-subunit fatty acid transport protein